MLDQLKAIFVLTKIVLNGTILLQKINTVHLVGGAAKTVLLGDKEIAVRIRGNSHYRN